MNKDQIHGALWGAVVGDALGVPVEFQSRQSLRTNPVTGMRGFGTHGQPAGTWSDDSSLLLCTVDSLVSCRGFNPADLGQRFVRWESFGYWTPHGDVFDVGMATFQAISHLAHGMSPEEAGGTDEYSNGNGSLMRILPMAIWFRESPDEELAVYARRASSLTHRHARSQMACALYCLMIKKLLDGASAEEAFEDARKSFGRIYASVPFAQERSHFQFLETGRLSNATEMEINSSGYVMHTLTAGIWCLLTSKSFEETVLKAVNLGGDTDTTGCVAGGLAGACYGAESIPEIWKATVAREQALAALFTQFTEAAPRAAAISDRQ
jgi:ADP-ribosylglycohydrolase